MPNLDMHRSRRTSSACRTCFPSSGLSRYASIGRDLSVTETSFGIEETSGAPAPAPGLSSPPDPESEEPQPAMPDNTTAAHRTVSGAVKRRVRIVMLILGWLVQCS